MTLVGFITEFGENWKYKLYRVDDDIDIEELREDHGDDGCSMLDFVIESGARDVSHVASLENAEYVFNAEGWE